MEKKRSSGLLLHITSLPGPYGVGDLGADAYQFADFLAHTGQTLWQVLPTVPVGYGYSPYASPSTFAGNPLFISPDRLRDAGLLTDEDLAATPTFPTDHVDFEAAIPFKQGLLRKAFDRFEHSAGGIMRQRFAAFCNREATWLDDYALFTTLDTTHDGVVWTEWEPGLAARKPAALAAARAQYAREIRMQKFWQFLFTEQWAAFKAYCNERGIRIFGDLPIYVAHDSADVWANPHLFYLDVHGTPTVVAGVPPDYFSVTGQRWGNPIYRWDVMREAGYAWWTRRFAKILEQVDLVRLDHFRGFEAYWEVPASEETAVNGNWVEGPKAELFEVLHEHLGPLPVIAENLGVITPGVVSLMEQFNFPGMAILQFAFDSDADNDFLPHNFQPHLVAYTGTHDNDTVVGWWQNTTSTQSAKAIEKAHAYCRAYLDFTEGNEADLHWRFVHALMASVAVIAIVPLQDLLGLGSEARMNTPGLGSGNWMWRFEPYLLNAEVAERLRTLAEIYGRAPKAEEED